MTGGNKLSASRLGFQHPKGDRGDGTQLKQYARASGSFSGGGLWAAAEGREGLTFRAEGTAAQRPGGENKRVCSSEEETHINEAFSLLCSPLFAAFHQLTFS